MASPFTIDTLITGGMDFQPSNRVAILGDGALLTADTTASNVTTLERITNPSTGTPTVNAVTTFTYGGGTSTALVADLVVNQNGSSAGVDDIWLVICSDSGAGSTIEVVHGTYTQATTTFAWDTKTSTGVTLVSPQSQVASIVWNGTNLIVAYRDGTWVVKVTWTATKNGTAGWQTAFQLNTATNAGSHANPMLRHDPKLAGGAGGTICLYTNDTVSTHSDRWAARVLLDSAASAASANWKAEVLSTVTAQNLGAALQACTVDPANGNVHLVYNSSVAGTGGAIGTSYIPVTVTSLGVPSFGTRVTVDTTSGASPAVCVDALGRIYVFYSSAALNSNSVIDYKTSDSPYTTFSGVNTTVFATTANGDNAPHVPSHDQAVSGYVPLLVQRGKTSWSSQFDNTIAAQSGGSSVALAGATNAISTFAGTLAEAVDLQGETDGISSLTGNLSTASGTSITGSAAGTSSFSGTLSIAEALAGSSASVSTEPGSLSKAVALAGTSAALSGFAATFLTFPIGLVVSTQTQTGISGGPPGNNTTETDVTWTDASGNGNRVGIIPAYGGAVLSARYEMVAGGPANLISQTSLVTSNPDGFIHVLANNGTFTGTEDPTFTLTEIGFGSAERRMYDSGTIQPGTGPALQYRIRVAIYPGDPMLIFTQIDITNPSASAVGLAGADGLEIALIGGMVSANQGAAATDAWPGTNGKYATAIGGTETAWPGDTTPGPAAADPVYVYTSPTANTGLSNSVFNVKILGLGPDVSLGTTPKISYLGPPDAASSRVKVKVQVTLASFPGSTTKTIQYVQGFKRSPGAGAINSIAADLRNPDASSIVSQGTPASPFFDQLNGWYDIAAVSNGVLFTHTIPSGGTARWLPAYRISNWTDTSGLVPVSLNGVPLVSGTDYIAAVDTTNHIAYVKFMFQLVASGASTGQKNNGQVEIGTALRSSMSGVGTFSGTLSVSTGLALAGSLTGISTQTGSLTVAVGLTGSAAGVSQVSGTASLSVAVQGSSSSPSNLQGTLAKAVAMGGQSSSVSNLSATLQLITGTQLAGSTASVGSFSGTISMGLGLSGSSGSQSQMTASLAIGLALAGSMGSASVFGAVLQILTGNPIFGATTGISRFTGTLSSSTALAGTARGTSGFLLALTLRTTLAGRMTGISTWMIVNAIAGPTFIIVPASAVDGKFTAESADGTFTAEAVDGILKASV